jgi:hypothetical protein
MVRHAPTNKILLPQTVMRPISCIAIYIALRNGEIFPQCDIDLVFPELD